MYTLLIQKAWISENIIYRVDYGQKGYCREYSGFTQKDCCLFTQHLHIITLHIYTSFHSGSNLFVVLWQTLGIFIVGEEIYEIYDIFIY